MAADFEGVHYLMPEAFQVDTQNLRGEGRCQSPWPSREGVTGELTDRSLTQA